MIEVFGMTFSQWGFFWSIFACLLTYDFFATAGGSVSTRKALVLCGFYTSMACLFSFMVEQQIQFLTIFAIEQLLSVDNLLVISLIFGYFSIPDRQRHTALLLGIAGVIIFRALFIFSGAALIDSYHWVLYVFAAFLIYSGYEIASGKEGDFDPDKKIIVRFLKRSFGKSGAFIGAILAIEISDVIFALDSIPASFSISTDPYTVMTANMFAVLGLRSLYHAIEHGLKMAAGIELYIGVALASLGVMTLAGPFVHIPEPFKIGFVVGIIGTGIYMSLGKVRRHAA